MPFRDKNDMFLGCMNLLMALAFIAAVIGIIIILHNESIHFMTGPCSDWANSAVQRVPVRCFNELTKGR